MGRSGSDGVLLFHCVLGLVGSGQNEWVSKVYRPHQHIIGHFGDEVGSECVAVVQMIGVCNYYHHHRLFVLEQQCIKQENKTV